jgi:lathosterol oxidase
MMNIALEFLGFFFFILILGYLIPAGMYYWKFHVRQSEKNEHLKIQHRQATREGIVREVKLSMMTITIFAAMSTVLFQLYKAGLTSIYTEVRSYPLIRVPVTVFVCMVIFDTYFYWSHRFMHWRPVFKYTHLGHHRSVSPTPWAIYAFQPAEAVIQFLGIMGLVIFVPMHPLSLLLFLAIDTQVNTAGHTGYEVVPRFISKLRIFQGFNTATHHDAHHTNFGKNYGAFFNVWDRWMGTFLDASTPPEPAVAGVEGSPVAESPELRQFEQAAAGNSVPGAHYKPKASTPRTQSLRPTH